MLLYCHDASFSVEKHPAFPMDQLPKECRRLLKQKPPAIFVAPNDLKRISRQGGTTQLRSAKSRWGEAGGIWFDEALDTVVEKGLTNYCSFSPRYQWQLVTSEATTAAQLTLQLSAGGQASFSQRSQAGPIRLEIRLSAALKPDRAGFKSSGGRQSHAPIRLKSPRLPARWPAQALG